MAISPALRKFMGGYYPMDEVPRPNGDEPSPTFPSPEMIPQRRTVNPLALESLTNAEDPNDPISALMNFTPETRANEEFTNLLHAFPTRDKPRFITRLMTALSQNPQLAEHAQQKNFYRNLEDWKAKVSPYQQAADNETQQNVNRRLIAGNIATARYKQDDLQRKITDSEAKNQLAGDRNKIAEQKLEIERDKARGGVIKQDESGAFNILFRDGSTKKYDVTGWTPADLEEAKQANRIELSDRKADQAADRAEIGKWAIHPTFTADGKPGPVYRINTATGEMDEIELKGNTTAKPPGTGSAARPQSATDRAKEVVNNANKLKAEHPEWAEFITVGRNGVEITKPNRTAFGVKLKSPDKATHDKIYEVIYGKGSSSVKPVSSHNSDLDKANANVAKLAGDKIHIRTADGKTGWISSSRLEAAKKKDPKLQVIP